MKYVTLGLGIMIAWAMLICTQMAAAEELVQRSYNIEGVEKIEASGAGDMEIVLGSKQSLEVTAPASTLDQLVVDAKSDTLRIKQKGSSFWQKLNPMDFDSHKVKYRLVLKKLSAIQANGDFKIRVLDPIENESFLIHLNGAANVELAKLSLSKNLEVHASGAAEFKIVELNANKLSVHASGASQFELTGQVQNQELHLSGASEVHARQLQSQSAQVYASGASEMDLWVTTKLEGDLSGASNLRFYGQPSQKVSTTGASEISNIGEKPNQ